MKSIAYKLILLLLVSGSSFSLFAQARRGEGAPDLNLTPKPNALKLIKGTCRLPRTFVISTNSLPDSIVAEARAFAGQLSSVTALRPQLASASSRALIQLHYRKEHMPSEAYQLIISPRRIDITASTTSGFFYAFRTLMQLMPSSVRALKPDAQLKSLRLPALEITDSPRFHYRGFMLDVSRHFFDVAEIKKMLRLMADYKMNRFHWHLTDDQGWRVEIKKYPRLTSVGAVAEDSRMVDMDKGVYWLRKPYGPYFYTQDEIRDVVAYARKFHIEVIPEVDMPGHFTAAMTAYPEYSCSPQGEHKVWTGWGISEDVLNVANPKAVQFAQDILEELIPLFPSKQIHIGGDECPTEAWEKNELCQSLVSREGLKSFRALQSRFILEMAAFLKQRGCRTCVWNEAITAKDAGLDDVKKAAPTVYCWNPAAAGARKAASMGLDNVVSFYGPYYINRKQSTDADEPDGAGNGADSLSVTYGAEAVPEGLPVEAEKHYKGVLATFWTEHVSDNRYLEYLALPRLIAIAEAGWTKRQNKDYKNFRRRVSADARYWKQAGYNYCPKQLLHTGVGK